MTIPALTYDDPVKDLSRDHLGEMLDKHILDKIKPQNVRIVTLAGAERKGEEALSVRRTYLPKGILAHNITAVEREREPAQLLRESNLGINVYEGDLEEFVERCAPGPYHLFELDYKGHQTPSVLRTLQTIAQRNLLGNFGIIFTNFYAQRESGMTKEMLQHMFSKYSYGRKMNMFSLESEEDVRRAIKAFDERIAAIQRVQNQFAYRPAYRAMGNGKGKLVNTRVNARLENIVNRALIKELNKTADFTDAPYREMEAGLADRKRFAEEMEQVSGDEPQSLDEARMAVTANTIEIMRHGGATFELMDKFRERHERMLATYKNLEQPDVLESVQESMEQYAELMAAGVYRPEANRRLSYRSNKGANMLVDIIYFSRPRDLARMVSELAVCENGKTVINPKKLDALRYLRKACNVMLEFGLYSRLSEVTEPVFLGSSAKAGREDEPSPLALADALLLTDKYTCDDIVRSFRVVHEGEVLTPHMLRAHKAWRTMRARHDETQDSEENVA